MPAGLIAGDAAVAAAPVPSPRLSSAWFRVGGLLLLTTALLLALMAQFTNVDLALADLAFDPAARRFAARDAWFAAVFMHAGLKWPLGAAGALVVLAALAERPGRWPRLRADQRLRLRASAVAVLAIPASISLLKRVSVSHCPWSLERYGGHAPYLRLFDVLPSGIDPGGCLPAGHASSALWLAGLCIWWLPARPRLAAIVFALGLAAGFALGWVQQWRGAHFLSHTLWSMWITAAWVWLAVLAIAPSQRAVNLEMV